MSVATYLAQTPWVLTGADETPSEGVDSIRSGGGCTVSNPRGAVTVTIDTAVLTTIETTWTPGGPGATMTIPAPNTSATDLLFWSFAGLPSVTSTVTLASFNTGPSGSIVFNSTSSDEDSKIQVAVFPVYTPPS